MVNLNDNYIYCNYFSLIMELSEYCSEAGPIEARNAEHKYTRTVKRFFVEVALVAAKRLASGARWLALFFMY